jgi:hypothetical protein
MPRAAQEQWLRELLINATHAMRSSFLDEPCICCVWFINKINMKNRKKNYINAWCTLPNTCEKLRVQIHSILIKNERTYYLLQTTIFVCSNTF